MISRLRERGAHVLPTAPACTPACDFPRVPAGHPDLDPVCIVRSVRDTSVWIGWRTGGALGKRLGHHFPDRTLSPVPCPVQPELSRRLIRDPGEEQADPVIACTHECVVVPLGTTTALPAADPHREHELATADAIVYATARHAGAELPACDINFKGMPEVALSTKTAYARAEVSR